MSFLEVFTMKMKVDVCFEFSDLASKRLGIFFTISSYTSFFLHGHAFILDMLSLEDCIQYVSCLSIYLFCCILMCIQTPPTVGAFGCGRNQVFGPAKYSVLGSDYNDSECVC